MTEGRRPDGGNGRPGLLTAHERLVILLACTAQFMVLLDVSIVNVALPSAGHDLHLAGGQLAWVIDAYTVAVAGLLLLGGRLGDLAGVRLVLSAGLALFTTASLAGGLAQDGIWLITARAAQGMGGALVAPSTLTVLTLTFAEGEQRRRAFALWSGLASTGTAVGGLVGGLLTAYLSWRWVMFVNVPVGAAALTGAWRLLPRAVPGGRAGGLDLPGTLTVSCGLAALAYALLGAVRAGWGAPGTLWPLAAAIGLLAAFPVIEARVAARPLVPLRLFASPWIRGATVVQALVGGAFFSMWYFVSLDLQDARHTSALRTGLAFVPLTVAIIAATQVSTRMLSRTGPRPPLLGGLLIAAAGMSWLSLLPAGAGYLTGTLAPSVIMAFGLGSVLTPLTTAATTGVRPAEAGLASGVLNASRQAGGAIGLAVLAALAAARTAQARSQGMHPLALALQAGYARAFAASAGLCLLAALATALLPAWHPSPAVPPPPAVAPALPPPPAVAPAVPPPPPPAPAGRPPRDTPFRRMKGRIGHPARARLRSRGEGT